MNVSDAQGKSRNMGAANPTSFANIVKNAKENAKVNFRAMESTETVEGADVVIPVTSVQQVNDRYANTLYGYFLGKRLAFLWSIILLKITGLNMVCHG